MSLRSTEPLAEISNGCISWGLRRPVRRADNLASFMCRLSRNSGPVQVCNRIHFFLEIHVYFLN
jgi:hypothetical protein